VGEALSFYSCFAFGFLMNESFFDKVYVWCKSLFSKPKKEVTPDYVLFLEAGKRAYNKRDYAAALNHFNLSLQDNYLTSNYRSISAACEANRYIGLILLERDFDDGDWWDESVARDIAAHFGLWSVVPNLDESVAANLSQASMYLFSHNYDLAKLAVREAKSKIFLLDENKREKFLERTRSLERILSL